MSHIQIKSFIMNHFNAFRLLQKFDDDLESCPRIRLTEKFRQIYEKMLLISKNKYIFIHASIT